MAAFFFYNIHGHILRFPPSEKAQLATECGIAAWKIQEPRLYEWEY